MSKIKVKLIKSMAGQISKNKKIVKALGLKKIGDEKTFEKNDAIMGMIKKVSYMLEVNEMN
ncbi:MAG: 50S ribosomal protein L30 [Candidatus Goldbacteria bacterium]|nr:50S ribosomal protein L30 [Candidatus Goldiibacteriota bacterium]